MNIRAVLAQTTKEGGAGIAGGPPQSVYIAAAVLIQIVARQAFAVRSRRGFLPRHGGKTGANKPAGGSLSEPLSICCCCSVHEGPIIVEIVTTVRAPGGVAATAPGTLPLSLLSSTITDIYSG
jgi:hypothetical protein